jgi:hypothetical protein
MPATPPETTERPRISRRASIIGSLIAVLALVGLGGLAWYPPARQAPLPVARAVRAGPAVQAHPAAEPAGAARLPPRSVSPPPSWPTFPSFWTHSAP